MRLAGRRAGCWNVAVDSTAVLAEFDRQMRRNPAAGPRSRVEREQRVTRLISGDDGWSGVLWADLTESDADAMIAAQVRRFAELGRPWEWKYYSYDQPAGLPGRLRAAGFVAEPAETLLVAHIADLDLDVSAPAGVELVPVTDARGVPAVVDVHNEVFGGDHAAIGSYITAALSAEPRQVEAVVAVAGDAPISDGWTSRRTVTSPACGAEGRCRPGAGAGCSGRWSPTAPGWPGTGDTGTSRSTPPPTAARSSSGWGSPNWPGRRPSSTPVTRASGSQPSRQAPREPAACLADDGLAPRARVEGAAVKSQNAHKETRRTVIIAGVGHGRGGQAQQIAGVANVVVGLAKLAAGIISGSSAMLAEAAHSVADTLNQVFLLTSLRQAERPADPDHPFGHGQERYFWSLLAAFGIFIAGAGFSIFEGILSLTRTQSESPLAAYITLAVAFVAEGTSFVRAYWQVRGEAGGRSEEVFHHVETSPDITVKVNLFEDSAAVVGLILAGLGVGLDQLTGSHVWDGVASIAIGVLLVVVAVKLGMDSRELLIGRAAAPEVQQLIRDEIESRPGVDELLELRTMHMGPDNIIVAARVALHDDLGADQAEDLADEIDRVLSEKLPIQPNVFIDPTQTRRTPQSEVARSSGRDATES
jgi:cation diffusion facilitator family transporter